MLLIRVFVIEFIEQYKWFGLSCTVHSWLVSCVCYWCIFLFYVLCLGLALWNLALFYATILINLLTYLFTHLLTYLLSCCFSPCPSWTGATIKIHLTITTTTTLVQWPLFQDNMCGFYWSKRLWVAVASAGTYANLHLAPDRCNTPQLSRYRKGETSLDLNEARDDGFWDALASAGSSICWTICKQSAPCSRQITTPTIQHLISQFLQAGSSSWCPTKSVKARKAKSTTEIHLNSTKISRNMCHFDHTNYYLFDVN